MREQTPRKPPTIKDVARAAGVSVGTASNVLQGKHELHAEPTVMRVIEASRSLEYRRNSVARSLVQRRTRTLGIVLDRFHGRLLANLYVASIVDGFMEVAVQRGYQIKIITLLDTKVDYVLSQLHDASVDGVIMVAPMSGSAALRWAETSGIAAVVAGSILPDTDVPCVDVDDEPAFEALTRSLIERGHRRIGFVAGPAHQFSAIRRERGYRAALAAHGIEPEPAWRFQGDYTAVTGSQAADSLLSVRPCLTAIVCTNDGTAIGLMERIATFGLSVPEDVSVVGFDGEPVGRFASPPLTTVRQPTHAIGMRAAEILVDEVETGTSSRAVERFAPEFVPGESSGPPRQCDEGCRHREAACAAV